MYDMGLGYYYKATLLRFTVRVRSSVRYDMGLGYYNKATYFLGSL